jgi:hypothetical protein
MSDVKLPDEVVVVVVVVVGDELEAEEGGERDVYKKIDDASVSGGLIVTSGCGDNGKNASKVRKMDVLRSFTIVNRAKNTEMLCNVMKKNHFSEREASFCVRSFLYEKVKTEHKKLTLSFVEKSSNNRET